MIDKITQLIDRISRFNHVDQEMVRAFRERLKADKRLTKYEGSMEHICSFFLPVHKESRSIYLGHHIKANDWIPPGGHIKEGESPLDAVMREFAEELGLKPELNNIEIFDLSVKPIGRPHMGCVTHYDFWHLVYVPEKHDFVYDKREFYDAGWFEFEKGIEMIKDNPSYKDVILKLAKLFS